MALTINNREVERLAVEVVRLTGETKTEAIRRALEERKPRLSFQASGADRGARLRRFLVDEVWPAIPASERGPLLASGEDFQKTDITLA